MQTDRIEGCCNALRLNKESDIEYETFTKVSKDGIKEEYGFVKEKIKTCYNNR
ncbi:hypothetical protein [uncultured Cyclobacterium sp.]|uniref:hypothetical protein n=1 Tax=uncultured Cyclobacterium sp. TaxID=453820 RepID=UPI0030EE2986|tara:strand:- start:6094 stop:6252 length:159 start_codon:yes stop_codon:yes gene_type:complete